MATVRAHFTYIHAPSARR